MTGFLGSHGIQWDLKTDASYGLNTFREKGFTRIEYQYHQAHGWYIGSRWNNPNK